MKESSVLPTAHRVPGSDRPRDFVPVRDIRVLVVDEDESLTGLVSRALAFEGWTATVAPSGAEALRMAAAERPDAILLDISLPDIDGVTVASRLRESGIDSPVVFLTGHSSLEDRLAAFGAGGDEYLTKPFSLAQVSDTLVRLFRQAGLSVSSTVVGDLVIDSESGEAWRAGERLMLSLAQFAILDQLGERRGSRMAPTELARSTGVPRTRVEFELPRLAAILDDDREPMLLVAADEWWLEDQIVATDPESTR